MTKSLEHASMMLSLNCYYSTASSIHKERPSDKSAHKHKQHCVGVTSTSSHDLLLELTQFLWTTVSLPPRVQTTSTTTNPELKSTNFSVPVVPSSSSPQRRDNIPARRPHTCPPKNPIYWLQKSLFFSLPPTTTASLTHEAHDCAISDFWTTILSFSLHTHSWP